MGGSLDERSPNELKFIHSLYNVINSGKANCFTSFYVFVNDSKLSPEIYVNLQRTDVQLQAYDIVQVMRCLDYGIMHDVLLPLCRSTKRHIKSNTYVSLCN